MEGPLTGAVAPDPLARVSRWTQGTSAHGSGPQTRQPPVSCQRRRQPSRGCCRWRQIKGSGEPGRVGNCPGQVYGGVCPLEQSDLHFPGLELLPTRPIQSFHHLSSSHSHWITAQFLHGHPYPCARHLPGYPVSQMPLLLPFNPFPREFSRNPSLTCSSSAPYPPMAPSALRVKFRLLPTACHLPASYPPLSFSLPPL